MTLPTILKRGLWGLSLLAALAAGCTTVGAGIGSAFSGATPVSFSWQNSDSLSGTMNATLSDGETYSGQFFQITKDTTLGSVAPLWAGWHRSWGGWGGWDYWDPVSSPSFITHYTGRVVANLGEGNGQHMRCKFQLVHPSEGMAGGGRGQCQMPDGETIDTNFPIA
jgi:hypothetical protein